MEHRTDDANAAERERAHWELTWSVELSVLYHRRREQWFDRVNGWCAFATVLSGMSGVAALLTGIHPAAPVAAAVVAAVAGVLLLTFGAPAQARLHSELAHDFTLLQRDLEAAGEDLPEHELRGFRARYRDVTSREPAALRVLSTMCHDELVDSYGIDPSHRGSPRWWQRWLANVVDVGAASLNKAEPGTPA